MCFCRAERCGVFMPFIVVPDACVLFPASLRDTMLRAAQADLYRIQLTDEILEEVRRNLVKKLMPEIKARRLVDTIRDAFEDAFVTPHKSLIDAMPNNEKDRHVLAAAVASRAQVIVTQNLKDFPQNFLAPFEVEAQSPDEFLVHLFHLDRERVAEILVKQAGALRNPSLTVPEVVETLKRHAPVFAKLVQNEFHLEDPYPWSHHTEVQSDVL